MNVTSIAIAVAGIFLLIVGFWIEIFSMRKPKPLPELKRNNPAAGLIAMGIILIALSVISLMPDIF